MAKDKRSAFWANRSGNNYSFENPMGFDPELMPNWFNSYVNPITSQIYNADNYQPILEQIRRNMPATYGSSNSDELFTRTAMEATMLPQMQAQMGYLQNLLPYMQTYTSTQEQMTPEEQWQWNQEHPTQQTQPMTSNLQSNVHGSATPFSNQPNWQLTDSTYNTPANDLINMFTQLDTAYTNMGQPSGSGAYSGFGSSAGSAGSAGSALGDLGKSRVMNQSIYNTSNNKGNSQIRNIIGSKMNSGTQQIRKPSNRRNQYV